MAESPQIWAKTPNSLYDDVTSFPERVTGAPCYEDDVNTVLHVRQVYQPRVVETGSITETQEQRLRRISQAQDEEVELHV
jgi:hypothetical protein